jgi:hypothetical protein
MLTLSFSRLAARLTRATSALNKGIVYRVGSGRTDPNSVDPGPECDGLHFISWVFGIPVGSAASWMIEQDVDGDHEHFAPIDNPVAGCGAVFPGGVAIVSDVAFDEGGQIVSIHGVTCHEDGIVEEDLYLPEYAECLPMFFVAIGDVA